MPNPLFQDHTVLQREMPVPVWGTAEAGEPVSVSFAGQTKSTHADAGGRWRITLDPLKANATAAEMTIRGKNSAIAVKDVLVGEVWLASGQSNMTFRFQPAFYPAEAAHPSPLIREANVGAAATMQEQAAGESHGCASIGPFARRKRSAKNSRPSPTSSPSD